MMQRTLGILMALLLALTALFLPTGRSEAAQWSSNQESPAFRHRECQAFGRRIVKTVPSSGVDTAAIVP